jgi:hypothetical protein
MSDPVRIKSEIDRLSARRTRLWHEHDGVAADARDEIASLTERIDALWTELRLARAELLAGPRARILTSARRAERAERELERLVRG